MSNPFNVSPRALRWTEQRLQEVRRILLNGGTWIELIEEHDQLAQVIEAETWEQLKARRQATIA